jgi:hypothetical protein
MNGTPDMMKEIPGRAPEAYDWRSVFPMVVRWLVVSDRD